MFLIPSFFVMSPWFDLGLGGGGGGGGGVKGLKHGVWELLGGFEIGVFGGLN
jgi:hypothetical protein